MENYYSLQSTLTACTCVPYGYSILTKQAEYQKKVIGVLK